MPWAANGLNYTGNCEWEPSTYPQPDAKPRELPTLTEGWIGRSDKTDAFRAKYHLGLYYLGGYIIANTPRSNSPFFGVDSVELVVALPPRFDDYSSSNGTSIKTATKSARISGSNIVPASLVPPGVTVPDPITATREVSYYAPETTYTYFASTRPEVPRYDAVLSKRKPQIIRNTIKVSLSSGEVAFTGAMAPAALVAALFMAPTETVTSHQAVSIPGTPWFTCTDVVTREMKGDN